MVARIAFRPLLRVLNEARENESWAELKLLLTDRLFVAREIQTKDHNPLPPILFQMATAYWVSQAIYVAAKLGIADLLADGPQSYAALAIATRSDPSSLFRLLRALSNVGVFSHKLIKTALRFPALRFPALRRRFGVMSLDLLGIY